MGKTSIRTIEVSVDSPKLWRKIKDPDLGLSYETADDTGRGYASVRLRLPVLSDVESVQIPAKNVSSVSSKNDSVIYKNGYILQSGKHGKLLKTAGSRKTVLIEISGYRAAIAQKAIVTTVWSTNLILAVSAFISIVALALLLAIWMTITFTDRPSLPWALSFIVATIVVYFGVRSKLQNLPLRIFDIIFSRPWAMFALLPFGFIACIYSFSYSYWLANSNSLARNITRFYSFAMADDTTDQTTENFVQFITHAGDRPEAWSILSTRIGLESSKNPVAAGHTVAKVLGVASEPLVSGDLKAGMITEAFTQMDIRCKTMTREYWLPVFPLVGAQKPPNDLPCLYARDAFSNIVNLFQGKERSLFLSVYDEMMSKTYLDHQKLVSYIDILKKISTLHIDDINSPDTILKLSQNISNLSIRRASPSEIRSGLSTAANAAIQGCNGAKDAEQQKRYEISALRVVGILFEQLFDETSEIGNPVYAGLLRNVPIAWYYGKVQNDQISKAYSRCLGNPTEFERKMKNREEVRHLRSSVGENFKFANNFYGRVSLQLEKQEKSKWHVATLRIGQRYRGY